MFRHKIAFLAICCVVGCSDNDQPVHRTAAPSPHLTADRPASFHPVKLETKHLPNSVRIHPKVISGSLPKDDAAFEELAGLGIRTIISVDGATPDVALARKYGMRYVHLPHGYDGIPDKRIRELALAIRDLDGPIYVHCHHGKHRSPAAAGVACVAAGLIPSSEAETVLEIAGTSKKYLGLFQAAKDARPLEASILDNLIVEFSETALVPPLAQAMVQLEHTHDRLQLIAESNWQTPPDHPDLEPAHEALLMRELFTEMLRTDEVQLQPARFVEILRDSELAAEQLEQSLRSWQSQQESGSPPTEITNLANRISNGCTNCHERYRDIPLQQK